MGDFSVLVRAENWKLNSMECSAISNVAGLWIIIFQLYLLGKMLSIGSINALQ